MTSNINNRKLSDIIPEFFSETETPRVVFCDAGNGCAFGESGSVVDYDPTTMADLIMTDIPDDDDKTSNDGVKSITQSQWQDADNGYCWRIRF